MSDWDSYRLQDFVPFSAEVYFRLQERMGEAFWPLHLAMLAAGAAALFLALRGRRRLACLLLAPAWAFVGVAYFLQRYGNLNWAGDYLGWAFIGEGGLLAVLAAIPGGAATRVPRATLPVIVGTTLATAGLLAWPLIALLFGYAWLHAETFGIHPTPTAVTTLGLLLIASRGAALWLAALIPLLWIALSGLTLTVLGAGWAPAVFVVLALGLGALVWKSAVTGQR
ncbi:DUF6064 family protein [Microbulbifer yueqingensis]|uniref:MFS transporter permease n=1 Tax=Microbulbifer yueqingensis TaxID=658219 RepID=A0A1G9AE08_9GAMM|nr:DUF6064 family protein [Microbulbifer yueqingensis]SDK25498.1 hypothetical protein SAMN05216212_1967 [Microbulbifer yueqingensis]